jgi:hypothetical protein
MNRKAQYKANKAAKVGDSCKCPSCNTVFTKTQHQQAFCKSKTGTVCKDAYWNMVTPTKRNNTTRISPASRAFMAQRQGSRDYDDTHPFSSEALGQWD